MKCSISAGSLEVDKAQAPTPLQNHTLLATEMLPTSNLHSAQHGAAKAALDTLAMLHGKP